MRKKGNQKQPIKDWLNNEEKTALEEIYMQFGVATDQLRRTPQTLRDITDLFNQITSHNLNSNELLRYMFNRRKAKDWPRLGTSAKKFESVLNSMNSSQIETLKQIYFELDEPSDEFLFKPELMRKIARRFEGLTGAKISSSILVAVIVAKRKRGLWVKIREPFADIADIKAFAEKGA